MVQTIYQMINKKTNARTECTKKYIQKWTKLGFEIESTRFGKLLDEEV
ncbi:hypothetical protein SAMN04487895_101623 [Paenibacillus sophorae]|uniref:Uncharacterized protein n=1 Tax=Paenibacillus sophorae TaxID=1333845 RepID=A0A1H8GSG3_9BACL|nr:hypothetical protein [Paenibacillus sophorae]QWU14320.1 hypothetical protein KP014_20655 [Paenibacillus sophorae]SEN46740.1 hypothetical protein SAMN04487895_101623 [Paenibacillus sophorae]